MRQFAKGEDPKSDKGNNNHETKETNFRSSNMLRFQGNVPLRREVHTRCIRLLALDKTNPYNIPLSVFQKESDTLESTSVASPATRARHTSGKLFCLVTIRHAARKLEFRLQRTGPFNALLCYGLFATVIRMR